MTTSPSEPVDNAQTDDDGSSASHTEGIDDRQLPEDLRPGPDNPLASEDTDLGDGDRPGDDEAVPDGEQPPGNPSIG